jgi:hypothetical protein
VCVCVRALTVLCSNTHPAAWCGRPEREEVVQDFAQEMEDLSVFVFKHGQPPDTCIPTVMTVPMCPR